MKVSNLFKSKIVEKTVDPGFTRTESQQEPFKSPDLVVLAEQANYEGVPILLEDVKTLAAKARYETNKTIEYVKSNAKSPDFKTYMELVEKNYVPIETLLENGAEYPKYTAPISEIHKAETLVRESKEFSEPFLHSLFLHLNRSEVMDHVLNKMYDPILRSVYGIKPVKNKAGKLVKPTISDALHKQQEEFRAGDNSNINNNLAVKYMLFKSREELESLIDFATGIRNNYPSPLEEELKNFVRYFSSTHDRINKQTLDILLQKNVREYESLWTIPKAVFVQSYGNPLNSYLTEVLTLELSKIVGSINEEVDDVINGIEDYINATGVGTLGIVNTILRNSVVEFSKQLRSTAGAKEANIKKEKEARDSIAYARFLEKINKSIKGINWL